MGSALRGISGNLGGIAGLKDVIGSVAGSITAESTGIGPILQSVVRSLNSTLNQAELLGKAGPFNAAAGQDLLKAFQVDLARLAYIAALEKALRKAKGHGHFNLATAVNDLWLALDGVKRGQQSGSPQVQNQADMMQAMSKILKQMHDSASSVIQNMRG